ncbi:MAG: hypothetical protein V4591_01755, partial [Bdellovibrionota bacterium]
MNFVKISFLFILNIILSPLYILLFLFCITLSFVPIFPSKTAKKNLKEHLNIQGIKAHLFIACIYLNYIFYIFEALILDPLKLTHCSLQSNFDLVEIRREMKKIYPQTKNLGFVYILPHMANVEMYRISVLKAHRIFQQEQLVAMAKPSKTKLINKLLLWYRIRPGMDVLWTDKDLLSNMRRVIKKGSSIAMLVDQKPQAGVCDGGRHRSGG